MAIEDPDDLAQDDVDQDREIDPDRIVGCAYWRCGELFEARSANHRYCRKACRSRQKKWERSQARKQARSSRRAQSG